MKLADNPIYLTQRRIIHRDGVLAPVLIAALIGLILLAGLIAGLVAPVVNNNHNQTPQTLGKTYYGWIIGLEISVLVLGGAAKISRVLGAERRAGLWEANCLTPMRPAEIVAGYWLGAPQREFFMAVVLAVAGAIMLPLAQLPLTLWLGTQLLVLSSALFFGLLAALLAMAGPKAQGNTWGMGVLGALLFIPWLLAFEGSAVVGFLLPIYPLLDLFGGWTTHRNEGEILGALYGQAVSPVLLSLLLQLGLGGCLWRAAIRKTSNPGQPLLGRGETIAIFTLLTVVQHALVWQSWDAGPRSIGFEELAFTHATMLVLGVLLLAVTSPQPGSVCLQILRASGGKRQGLSIWSTLATAVALAALGALPSLPGPLLAAAHQHGWEWDEDQRIWQWLQTAVNLLEFYLMFTLLLQYCQVRFGRRAPGFFALGLFVLCLLPLILAVVLSSGDYAKFSFFAPGIVALTGSETDGRMVSGILAVHAVVLVFIYVMWRRQWQRLLAAATADAAAKTAM